MTHRPKGTCCRCGTEANIFSVWFRDLAETEPIWCCPNCWPEILAEVKKGVQPQAHDDSASKAGPLHAAEDHWQQMIFQRLDKLVFFDEGFWREKKCLGDTSMSQPNPARRIVLMVGELHRVGYGRLRLAPWMSLSDWKASIAPVRIMRKENGAKIDSFAQRDYAIYTTSQGDQFFGWEDATLDSPDELAIKFTSRFQEVAEAGRGEDAQYVRWYDEMVRATEPSGLIYAYRDRYIWRDLYGDLYAVIAWGGDSDPAYLNVIGESSQFKIPNPPAGECC